ncbi:hypothetical protein GQF56_07260 [Rhodobacter sphaeroides]|jgi:Phage major tail protein 2.|uniref:Phage major tail protein 2 n=1 Tax=Cereibacter sphaeroides (strain ATCC 17023 / DSM 158 / JCM 6121 / CCUG 31486 / LMG 2827 / NBRC 12203 / NCIMB 8253 / ATH 2.4.1.) TaxID=272943 RepID=U5NMQ2_CERS4|nr:phage tail tube protein [Cereibacter sphaeroides]AGY32416.1 Phage major tail protein 2 [Cereibacter sphaeroides 2.4.1]AXC61367.1 hypothetical protein DQL45_08325 [Cereibacter sphaeroides 2.4.1]MVX47670.1 hypothetical protein [Cereibacter sphaeroides]QHA10963.1 hypothetical protein GQR99_08320 [Cereibacter sphaeroides]QHA13450.1 hypothetical protein GQY06_08305 [Cereibacter sphaeroides]
MTIAIGIDAKVEIGRGATPTWTELAYVTDITLPEFTRDKIEVTHQKSPSGKKEYIPGLGEFSDMTAAMHYVPGSATDDLLLELQDSGETVKVRVTLKGEDGPVVSTYSGFMQGYSRNIPVGDVMEAEATFSINALVVGP